MNSKALGRELSNMRRSAALSQADLAKTLNVTPPTISHWEGGHREPSLEVIVAFARACGFTAELVFKNDDHPASAVDAHHHTLDAQGRFLAAAVAGLPEAHGRRILALIHIIGKLPDSVVSTLDDMIAGWAVRHRDR